jgi:protein TonB
MVGVPLATGPGVVRLVDVPRPPPQPKPVPSVNDPVKPRPVGGDVLSAKLLKRVMPVYPPLAKQARISGIVHLVGVVSKDGTIQQLRVVDGHPLLVGAALDAVRQWVYRPTLLNGEPVEVIAPIDVIFTLSQ